MLSEERFYSLQVVFTISEELNTCEFLYDMELSLDENIGFLLFTTGFVKSIEE